KLGKHMERKRRKEEKTSPILILIIKIRLVFFLRVDYCPTLIQKVALIDLQQTLFSISSITVYSFLSVLPCL
ncbi:hypothetical protein, partial [Enterococcus larvae]|uniref:hypothetical protein n=1 Tax=Enterococcus larvae TaxID=2794352 RepID=UPI001FD80244